MWGGCWCAINPSCLTGCGELTGATILRHQRRRHTVTNYQAAVGQVLRRIVFRGLSFTSTASTSLVLKREGEKERRREEEEEKKHVSIQPHTSQPSCPSPEPLFVFPAVRVIVPSRLRTALRTFPCSTCHSCLGGTSHEDVMIIHPMERERERKSTANNLENDSIVHATGNAFHCNFLPPKTCSPWFLGHSGPVHLEPWSTMHGLDYLAITLVRWLYNSMPGGGGKQKRGPRTHSFNPPSPEYTHTDKTKHTETRMYFNKHRIHAAVRHRTMPFSIHYPMILQSQVPWLWLDLMFLQHMESYRIRNKNGIKRSRKRLTVVYHFYPPPTRSQLFPAFSRLSPFLLQWSLGKDVLFPSLDEARALKPSNGSVHMTSARSCQGYANEAWIGAFATRERERKKRSPEKVSVFKDCPKE